MRRGAYAFALGRCVGAQGVLQAVTQLRQNAFGQVARVLRHEVDPDAFGPDQAHDLLDLLHQRRRGIIEQEMGLIEKEDEAWLVRVAHFGKLLEEFRQQPQQEGGIELGAVDQARRVQHVHDAASVCVRPHHVGQL